jgi:hypothetical protein
MANRLPAPGFLERNGVTFRGMARSVLPGREWTKRWSEKTAQAVCRALENPRSQAEYDWALGFATGYVRKLTRKANGRAIVNFSQAQLRESGLAVADRVIVLPLAEGGVLIRCASEEDLIAAHMRYARTPPSPSRLRPRTEDLPELEKRCPQCGLTYLTRSPLQVFCSECRKERQRAQYRACWARRGKLRASYRRKLKPRALSEAQPAAASA